MDGLSAWVRTPLLVRIPLLTVVSLQVVFPCKERNITFMTQFIVFEFCQGLRIFYIYLLQILCMPVAFLLAFPWIIVFRQVFFKGGDHKVFSDPKNIWPCISCGTLKLSLSTVSLSRQWHGILDFAYCPRSSVLDVTFEFESGRFVRQPVSLLFAATPWWRDPTRS